jgi:hypothetical protein
LLTGRLAQRKSTSLTWRGSQVRSLHRPPDFSLKNRRKCSTSGADASASTSLNEPRTVPNCADRLGKRRAKRSRKVPDGPPITRSPTPVDETGAGPKANNSSLRKNKNSKKPTKTQEIERHHLAVSDGHVTVGFIDQEGECFSSTDADGRKLGVFQSLRTAFYAVSVACEGVR